MEMDSSNAGDSGRDIFYSVGLFGAAPFVVKALMPALDSASEEGLFMKGFEIYFRPIEKVCNWWPWYDDWGTEIVE